MLRRDCTKHEMNNGFHLITLITSQMFCLLLSRCLCFVFRSLRVNIFYMSLLFTIGFGYHWLKGTIFRDYKSLSSRKQLMMFIQKIRTQHLRSHGYLLMFFAANPSQYNFSDWLGWNLINSIKNRKGWQTRQSLRIRCRVPSFTLFLLHAPSSHKPNDFFHEKGPKIDQFCSCNKVWPSQ